MADHKIKERVVLDFARRYNCTCLVETGTLYGEMVAAVLNDFERIYSIELSEPLALMASTRFASHDNVRIVPGDSGEVLPFVLLGLKSKTLFWLDGHFSGPLGARGKKDTPILEELDAIFNTDDPTRFVILIDDARIFGSNPTYPTQEALRNFVAARAPDFDFTLLPEDIIALTPKEPR